MCFVSYVGDRFSKTYPVVPENMGINDYLQTLNYGSPTRIEFDTLKKEVLELKKLLEKAVQFDKANNQPHCEMKEKIAALKSVAKLVGVSLDDVFGK